MKMKGKLRCHIKRQVSVILTLAMLLTMIPTTGFAVESSGNIPVEEGKASPSNVAVGQKDDRVQAKATDADADIDLENDLDLATPGDAISLSEEALTFIASVEELDQEYLMRLIDDYAEAWKAYHSMTAKEDVEEAELAHAEEACIAAENALLEAYDEAELYRLYEFIPEEEKAYESVVDAYEKLEGIHGIYQKVMQELTGIAAYAKQGYYQVVSVEDIYDKNWDYTADELEISTPEELAAYSYWSNKEKDAFKNKRIVLTDDIDISGIRWKPIGCDLDGVMVGSFDGQGYTVTIDVVELHMIEEGNKYYFGGLFGVPTGSSIENVRVEGSIHISGDVKYAYIGSVAAILSDNNAVIKNCSSSVDITFINTPTASYLGGLVGRIESAELEHCSYEGDIHIGDGNATYTGGIVGFIASGGSVQHASSSGSIVYDNGSASCGDGIAGQMSADMSRITGCSSDMDITAALGYFGGIVGFNVYGSVSNAYFNGSVEKSNGDLLPAFGQKRDTATFESCGYAEGSGHNDNGIPGVTCITADMTPDEVLNALNTAGELPWFTYVGGEPVLISLPEEAVVTRGLDGVRYVQEGDTISFTVSAASPDGGTLIYQWQKDGKDIELGDNPSYSIPVVASDSGGIYSVTVKNQNPRGEISDGADGGSCQLIVVKKGDIQIASGGYQGGWTKDPVTFELSGGLSDYLLGYEYLSTGAGEKPGAADTRWSLCEGALQNTVTVSGEGESYYWFRTRNQAGETGDAEGPVRVRIDRTAPILAPLVVTENEPDTEQAVIRLRASDAMSGVKEIYYLVRNVGEVAPSSGQIQTGTSCQPGDVRITGLSAGSSYRIYAVASDLAGNISEIQSVEVKKEKSTEEPVRPVRSSEEADSNTGSWVGANGSTGYIKPDGSRCRSEWYLIHGEWYYFDENGRMLIGWYFDPAYQAWFYLKPDGAMAVGWIRLPDGKWYYLNPVSDGRRGAMYADAWIDGYYLGKDGAWIP